MSRDAVLELGKKKHRRTLDKVGGISTVIGEESVFNGEFKGNENCIVYGQVIGDCDLTGTVVLEEGSVWTGTVKAENVIVAGTVKGEVVATKKLELTHTAKVTGDVTGPVIAVAEGAVIEGNMHMAETVDVTRFNEKRSRVSP